MNSGKKIIQNHILDRELEGDSQKISGILLSGVCLVWGCQKFLNCLRRCYLHCLMSWNLNWLWQIWETGAVDRMIWTQQSITYSQIKFDFGSNHSLIFLQRLSKLKPVCISTSMKASIQGSGQSLLYPAVLWGHCLYWDVGSGVKLWQLREKCH